MKPAPIFRLRSDEFSTEEISISTPTPELNSPVYLGGERHCKIKEHSTMPSEFPLRQDSSSERSIWIQVHKSRVQRGSTTSIYKYVIQYIKMNQ